ncbi:MAG: hypothetical protein HY692_05215 [Cyanobacteria bacterium NC_groundwater_1444_Ag_S-0.65um_54_12]|nr:hypothetical protein [Cyanobacteria bacterium NC_groundwater_1444_Ag_S-0.65um_54_12]
MSVVISGLLLPTGCLYVMNKAQPWSETIAANPLRVERGAYLVERVAACFNCHPSANNAKMSRYFGRTREIPGKIYAPNISADPETGIGNWTDGQLSRAIREGVDNNDEALFPIMPYGSYSAISDEDVRSIIVYLRSLPAWQTRVPERQIAFPMSLLINLLPQPVKGPLNAPDRRDLIKDGGYIAAVAGCVTCHTPLNWRGPDTSHSYAGGWKFVLADEKAEVISPNITADPQFGIGSWTDGQLKYALQSGRRPDGKLLRAPMPWQSYAGMTEADMVSLLAFLRTIPPLRPATGSM